MSRRCQICGKKRVTGATVTRRGMAKKKGGVGKKTTGITKRKFYPNLKKKTIIVKGKAQTVLVCTKCIKSGKLIFAGRKNPAVSNN